MPENPEDERLLTAAEVAQMFGVNDRQPSVWAKRGLLPFIRTPGGAYRFRPAVVRQLLQRQDTAR